MNKILGILLVIGIVIYSISCITIAVGWFSLNKEMEQDIFGWLRRTESATTAEGIANYLDNALAGLDKWGMNEGNWDVIFPNANTDMGVAYEQLSDLRDRAREVEAQETSGSMGYGQALEEIKTTFSKISINPYHWYTLRNDIILYSPVTFVIVASPLFVILFSLIGYIFLEVWRDR